MNYYGEVSFTWEDVKAQNSSWGQEKCEKFLSHFEDDIYEAGLSAGWAVIQDGVKEWEDKVANTPNELGYQL